MVAGDDLAGDVLRQDNAEAVRQRNTPTRFELSHPAREVFAQSTTLDDTRPR